MDGKTTAFVLAIVACGGAAWWTSRDVEPDDVQRVDDPQRRAPGDEVLFLESAVPPAAVPAPIVAIDRRTGRLVRSDNLHAAGTRRDATLGPVAHGIRCPDGSHLPLLNGVDAAPPILRSPDRGPLPPVVAVVVDRDGWDWYEHADGSTTTSRPHVLVDAQGQRTARVVTVHNAPGDGAMAETPFESPRPEHDR